MGQLAIDDHVYEIPAASTLFSLISLISLIDVTDAIVIVDDTHSQTATAPSSR